VVSCVQSVLHTLDAQDLWSFPGHPPGFRYSVEKLGEAWNILLCVNLIGTANFLAVEVPV